MPRTHPRMKLSREEDAFLREWMRDELQYRVRIGPAKRFQRGHGVTSADIAVLPPRHSRTRPIVAVRWRA